MAVRNFWVSADVDGRETRVTGGPRRKDGGMDGVIYQRENGGVARVFEWWSRSYTAYEDALLTTITLKQDVTVRVPTGGTMELPAGTELTFKSER